MYSSLNKNLPTFECRVLINYTGKKQQMIKNTITTPVNNCLKVEDMLNS